MPVQMIENQVAQVIGWALAIEHRQGREFFLDLFRHGRFQFLGAFTKGRGCRAGLVVMCHVQ